MLSSVMLVKALGLGVALTPFLAHLPSLATSRIPGGGSIYLFPNHIIYDALENSTARFS